VSIENTVRIIRKPDGSVWQIMADGSHQPYVEDVEANRERFNATTEEEIEAQRLEDLDLFDDDHAIRVPNVREIRERLGLSPEAFAERFALNPWQVKRWEAREEHTSWETNLYLRVIDTHPEAVDDAIRAYRSPRAVPKKEEPKSQPPAPMPGKRRKSA
jgi:putative transcriptional regulator